MTNKRTKQCLLCGRILSASQFRNHLGACATKKKEPSTLYSKPSIYLSTQGELVKLDSSYEVTVAQELDQHNISWFRPPPLPWTDKDDYLRRYFPDFYLPDHKVYLDPKNSFLARRHRDKIQRVRDQNKVRILIINKYNLSWPKILEKIQLLG